MLWIKLTDKGLDLLLKAIYAELKPEIEKLKDSGEVIDFLYAKIVEQEYISIIYGQDDILVSKLFDMIK